MTKLNLDGLLNAERVRIKPVSEWGLVDVNAWSSFAESSSFRFEVIVLFRDDEDKQFPIYLK